MPKFLGHKSKLIAEAAQRETAALLALQTAESHRVIELAQEVLQSRAEKDRARSEAEDVFVCAWCRDNDGESGEFRSKKRLVLEVTGAFLFDEEGETTLEHRSREQPFYLVACGGCNRGLGLIDHLME
jgi:hypothetical protein